MRRGCSSADRARTPCTSREAPDSSQRRSPRPSRRAKAGVPSCSRQRGLVNNAAGALGLSSSTGRPDPPVVIGWSAARRRGGLSESGVLCRRQSRIIACDARPPPSNPWLSGPALLAMVVVLCVPSQRCPRHPKPEARGEAKAIALFRASEGDYLNGRFRTRSNKDLAARKLVSKPVMTYTPGARVRGPRKVPEAAEEYGALTRRGRTTAGRRGDPMRIVGIRRGIERCVPPEAGRSSAERRPNAPRSRGSATRPIAHGMTSDGATRRDTRPSAVRA